MELKEGVFDISIEEYHSGGGVSRSMLMEFQRSPLHYHYKYLNPDYIKPEPVDIITPRNALEFGNALHTFVLEWDAFYDRYAVWEGESRATKRGKEEWIKVYEDAGSRSILSVEAYKLIIKMSSAITCNNLASSLLYGGVNEKSIMWRGPGSGIYFKVRPDVWHENVVVDLKTAADASPDTFEKTIYSRGYHLQAAMIRAGIFNATHTTINNFVFVAIEKEPPYAIGIYQLDEVALEVGDAEFLKLTKSLYNCIHTNDWPSYPSKTLTLPNYIMNKVSL